MGLLGEQEEDEEETSDNKPDLDTLDLEPFMPTIFYTNALRNEGTGDVLRFLLDMATPSQSWEIEDPESCPTNLSPEERATEVIREKLYRYLHKELPYHIQLRNLVFQQRHMMPTTSAPDTETNKNNNGQSLSRGLRIDHELIVKTKSHRSILMSSNGRTLEVIRASAEQDLSKLFDCQVVLHLHVKLLSKSQLRNRR